MTGHGKSLSYVQTYPKENLNSKTKCFHLQVESKVLWLVQVHAARKETVKKNYYPWKTLVSWSAPAYMSISSNIHLRIFDYECCSIWDFQYFNFQHKLMCCVQQNIAIDDHQLTNFSQWIKGYFISINTFISNKN